MKCYCWCYCFPKMSMLLIFGCIVESIFYCEMFCYNSNNGNDKYCYYYLCN